LYFFHEYNHFKSIYGRNVDCPELPVQKINSTAWPISGRMIFADNQAELLMVYYFLLYQSFRGKVLQEESESR